MNFPVFDFLARRADIGPDRIALEDIVLGECVSYRDLQLRAGQIAALLISIGVSRGDRVAVLCRNRIEFFELLFACASLGLILVPLNWRMPALELDSLLEDCGTACLFYGLEDRETVFRISHPLPLKLDFDDKGVDGFAARRQTMKPFQGRRVWPADQTWYLLYTSGTTGKPKAVIQTYGMAIANYVNISQAMGLRSDDTSLNYLPLFHTGGINLTTLPMLILGGRTLITHGFDLERTIELLQTGALDTFFGVPAIYQAISLHQKFDDLDLSQVRCWGCGGAPMPDNLLQRYAARGATVLNGMGMTETGPTVFLMDEANAVAKIGSVGKPQLLASVRLVDKAGNDVSQGEIGELWFSGLGITPGYYQRPAETRQALTADGWLRSGDLGRQDEDGYYYIVGRLKDMYISGGENVYAAEVEKQLASHPDILEAAVIAVADEKWGEVGHAYLLVRPGHELPADEEISLFCRQHLAAYKVPRQYIPVSDFPRTAAGKIQKHLLNKPQDTSQ